MNNINRMIKLKKGPYCNIEVNPRFPTKIVLIDPKTLLALQHAQNLLPENLKLVLTRAYQKETALLKTFRKIGRCVFKLIYFKRIEELDEIFSHNGHSTDGSHVDIGIKLNGQKIILLPWNVFTSLSTIYKLKDANSEILTKVYKALTLANFDIHLNCTESLQIHCDFRDVK